MSIRRLCPPNHIDCQFFRFAGELLGFLLLRVKPGETVSACYDDKRDAIVYTKSSRQHHSYSVSAYELEFARLSPANWAELISDKWEGR